jgi:hypothetical protein
MQDALDGQSGAALVWHQYLQGLQHVSGHAAAANIAGNVCKTRARQESGVSQRTGPADTGRHKDAPSRQTVDSMQSMVIFPSITADTGKLQLEEPTLPSLR